MCLVHKQTVNTKLLKGHDVILSALVVKLCKFGFDLLSCFGKLLDGYSVTSRCLDLLNTLQYLVSLIVKRFDLSFKGHRDLLKLRVTDNNCIVVTRCNSRAELLTVLGFKVLLGSDKDICTRIELQILTCPLLNKVVGYDKHTLVTESESLALLRRRNHRKGLTCTNNVGKQRVTAVHNSCHGIALMLSQGDLGVHTKELDVATVKLSGAKAVEALIVELTKSLTPCRVFPYPLIKCSLDLLLLTLCDCSFLFVEDLFLVSVLVNGIVKDTHVLEVQALLDDLITVDSMSTVSVCRLDVSSVSCLIGYDPL